MTNTIAEDRISVKEFIINLWRIERMGKMPQKRFRADGLRKPREHSDIVKSYVAMQAIENMDMPRVQLATKVIKDLKKMGEVPPTPGTAAKMITAARKKYSPLDEKWTLAACKEYWMYFPPDCIKYIVCLKKNLDKIMDRFMKDTVNLAETKLGKLPFPIPADILTGGQFIERLKNIASVNSFNLSIRDAIWYVILRPFIEEALSEMQIKDETKGGAEEIKLYFHFLIAKTYSIQEALFFFLNKDKNDKNQDEKDKKKFDSSELDQLLWEKKVEQLALGSFNQFLKTFSQKMTEQDKEFQKLAEQDPEMTEFMSKFAKGKVSFNKNKIEEKEAETE
ncbi:MAG: hypothetical protein FWF37_04095 [Chloroflexi bacterium]|nr:hypothetical protein [Chloroflexota bacterium]